MKTKMSSKGKIVLRAKLREKDDEHRLTGHDTPPNERVVDWLLACPEKGFFVPIESESTDGL